MPPERPRHSAVYPVSSQLHARVADAFDRLLRSLDDRDYTGFDLYDGLLAKRLRFIARGPRTRQMVVQTVRRLPTRARPLLGIEPTQHIKTLALSLSACAILIRSNQRPDLVPLADRLAAAVDAAFLTEQPGWAYPYDVQTRWGMYPATAPNAIASAFALDALVLYQNATSAPLRLSALARAVDIADAFWVSTGGSEGRGFFSYYPGSRTHIINANLVLASALSRVLPATDSRLGSAIDAGIAVQSHDGSWPYGVGPQLRWIDGFHTCFNLLALRRITGTLASDRARTARRIGLTFFESHLMSPTGHARPSPANSWPVDVHAQATALAALASLHDDSDNPDLVQRAAGIALDELQRPDGTYGFRIGRRIRLMTNYPRWGDAHMLFGFACLLAPTGQLVDHLSMPAVGIDE